MSRQSEVRPLSRDQVLDELEFLLTVEHALIVEYLSVSCALGYDLATADGGPATEAGRDAATAARALADDQMLRAGGVVRALSGLRPTGAFGRARGIVDATGREIPLGPPTREQLEHLLEREESIAAAVDARYARLGSAVAVGGPEGDAFPDDLRAAVERGTTHANAVSVLRDHLGDRPVAELLRATRRFGGTEPEKVLLRISDRTYALVLGALENFFGDLHGDLGGTFRLMALGAMDVMNDVNRALVHVGLLPPFRMPSA
jgi:hypothetical protein